MSSNSKIYHGSFGAVIEATVAEQVENISKQVVSRGVRAVNVIRNAELEVLKGQRSGKVYKKPYSKATYRASAPGEPPARRTGELRLNWKGQVKSGVASTADGTAIIAQLESGTSYAGYLENGTSHMKARPYVDKITEKAQEKIEQIYREPYA